MGDALVPFVYSLNIKRDSEAPAGGRSFSCVEIYIPQKSGHMRGKWAMGMAVCALLTQS